MRQQSVLVHMLEDMYGIKLNFRAFSFYPNYLYFGMAMTANPKLSESRQLWDKIVRVLTKNRWKVYAAYDHVNPLSNVPRKFDTFEDLGFDHVQLLLSELVLVDLNYPSHGVGQQLELSLFQPLIGFSKSPVSRMVTGRPGSLILKYADDEELLKMLEVIFKRKSFSKEPFYVRKNSFRNLKSIYKGRVCLNEQCQNQAW